MNRETQLECKPKPLLSSIIRIKNSTSKRILHTATLDEDNAGDFSALYLIFHCTAFLLVNINKTTKNWKYTLKLQCVPKTLPVHWPLHLSYWIDIFSFVFFFEEVSQSCLKTPVQRSLKDLSPSADTQRYFSVSPCVCDVTLAGLCGRVLAGRRRGTTESSSPCCPVSVSSLWPGRSLARPAPANPLQIC